MHESLLFCLKGVGNWLCKVKNEMRWGRNASLIDGGAPCFLFIFGIYKQVSYFYVIKF